MIIYLHGFASAPSSRKAQYFRERFREKGVEIAIPDMAGGDFEHLTITGQLRIIESIAAGRPVSLMGSSMGGYMAALYASRHPEVERLVLLAPALHFPQTWANRLGEEQVEEWTRTRKLSVFHYGDLRERLLDYGIVEDAALYEPAPNFSQPALLFHGRRDDVVPYRDSEAFAATHPNVTLRLVESGHELTDRVEEIWAATSDFLGLNR